MRITLKLATSLDGRIAAASGESRWITGQAAREQVHRLRAAHSAVLVGVETAIADDPELTVRLPGFMGRQPARVVLDSRLRLPPASKLVIDARRLPTIAIGLENSNDRLTDAGVTVLKVPETDGRPNLVEAMSALHSHLIASTDDVEPAVMVEGGGQVAASFIAAGLVDAIEWFRAPIILGNEGRPAVGDFVLERLSDAPRFRRTSVTELGADLWERYERA